MDNTLILFVVSALVLLVIPGPAVLYIVARSIQGGVSAGIVSAGGVVTAGIVHVAAAAMGVSALLMKYPGAIASIKVLGGCYFVYLGISTLRAVRHDVTVDPNPRIRSYGRIYRDGFLVNLLNPKTILFFVAFLPQFVNWDKADPQRQFLILGAILVLLGFLTDSIYAIIAGRATRWMKQTGRKQNYQYYIPSAVYFGLGVFSFLS